MYRCIENLIVRVEQDKVYLIGIREGSFFDGWVRELPLHRGTYNNEDEFYHVVYSWLAELLAIGPRDGHFRQKCEFVVPLLRNDATGLCTKPDTSICNTLFKERFKEEYESKN